MKIAPLLAAASLAVASAWAGEFNERNGAALSGHDPVAYFVEGKPVAGQVSLRLEHQGSTFLFSSAANRDAFTANPAKYAPQYGGYCAYGVSRGYKADIDPAAFTIVDGKLYLNYNRQVQADWLKDVPGYIAKADARWDDVRRIEKVIR
jgi:YHS domain-containing protein